MPSGNPLDVLLDCSVNQRLFIGNSPGVSFSPSDIPSEVSAERPHILEFILDFIFFSGNHPGVLGLSDLSGILSEVPPKIL